MDNLPDLSWLLFDLSSVHCVAILTWVVDYAARVARDSVTARIHNLIDVDELLAAQTLLTRLFVVTEVLFGPAYYGAHCAWEWGARWLEASLGVSQDFSGFVLVGLYFVNLGMIVQTAFKLGTFNAMTPPIVRSMWMVRAVSVLLTSIYITLEMFSIGGKMQLAQKIDFLFSA